MPEELQKFFDWWNELEKAYARKYGNKYEYFSFPDAHGILDYYKDTRKRGFRAALTSACPLPDVYENVIELLRSGEMDGKIPKEDIDGILKDEWNDKFESIHDRWETVQLQSNTTTHYYEEDLNPNIKYFFDFWKDMEKNFKETYPEEYEKYGFPDGDAFLGICQTPNEKTLKAGVEAGFIWPNAYENMKTLIRSGKLDQTLTVEDKELILKDEWDDRFFQIWGDWTILMSSVGKYYDEAVKAGDKFINRVKSYKEEKARKEKLERELAIRREEEQRRKEESEIAHEKFLQGWYERKIYVKEDEIALKKAQARAEMDELEWLRKYQPDRYMIYKMGVDIRQKQQARGDEKRRKELEAFLKKNEAKRTEEEKEKDKIEEEERRKEYNQEVLVRKAIRFRNDEKREQDKKDDEALKLREDQEKRDLEGRVYKEFLSRRISEVKPLLEEWDELAEKADEEYAKNPGDTENYVKNLVRMEILEYQIRTCGGSSPLRFMTSPADLKKMEQLRLGMSDESEQMEFQKLLEERKNYEAEYSRLSRNIGIERENLSKKQNKRIDTELDQNIEERERDRWKAAGREDCDRLEEERTKLAQKQSEERNEIQEARKKRDKEELKARVAAWQQREAERKKAKQERLDELHARYEQKRLAEEKKEEEKKEKLAQIEKELEERVAKQREASEKARDEALVTGNDEDVEVEEEVEEEVEAEIEDDEDEYDPREETRKLAEQKRRKAKYGNEEKAEEPKPEEKVEEPKPEEKVETQKPEEKAEEPKTEEKVEEPKPEEKVEEPKTEEKVEEPKPEEKVETQKPEEKVEEPKTEEKVEEPKPEEKVEEPKAEEPKTEEKVEEPKPEELKPEPTNDTTEKKEEISEVKPEVQQIIAKPEEEKMPEKEKEVTKEITEETKNEIKEEITEEPKNEIEVKEESKSNDGQKIAVPENNKELTPGINKETQVNPENQGQSKQPEPAKTEEKPATTEKSETKKNTSEEEKAAEERETERALIDFRNKWEKVRKNLASDNGLYLSNIPTLGNILAEEKGCFGLVNFDYLGSVSELTQKYPKTAQYMVDAGLLKDNSEEGWNVFNEEWRKNSGKWYDPNKKLENRENAKKRLNGDFSDWNVQRQLDYVNDEVEVKRAIRTLVAEQEYYENYNGLSDDEKKVLDSNDISALNQKYQEKEKVGKEQEGGNLAPNQQEKPIDPKMQEYLEKRIEHVQNIERAQLDILADGRKESPYGQMTSDPVNKSCEFVAEYEQNYRHPLQKTNNGCWSVVLAEMLKHKGVTVSQDDIRQFKPKTLDAKVMAQANVDIGQDISEHANLVHQVLPNTMVNGVQFDFKEEAKAYNQKLEGITDTNQRNEIEDSKQIAFATAKEKLHEGLYHSMTDGKSPVGIWYNNHYQLVYAIDQDTVRTKEPYRHEMSDAMRLDTMVGDILKSGGQCKIEWLREFEVDETGKITGVSDAMADELKKTPDAEQVFHKEKENLVCSWLPETKYTPAQLEELKKQAKEKKKELDSLRNKIDSWSEKNREIFDKCDKDGKKELKLNAVVREEDVDENKDNIINTDNIIRTDAPQEALSTDRIYTTSQLKGFDSQIVGLNTEANALGKQVGELSDNEEKLRTAIEEKAKLIDSIETALKNGEKPTEDELKLASEIKSPKALEEIRGQESKLLAYKKQLVKTKEKLEEQRKANSEELTSKMKDLKKKVQENSEKQAELDIVRNENQAKRKEIAEILSAIEGTKDRGWFVSDNHEKFHRMVDALHAYTENDNMESAAGAAKDLHDMCMDYVEKHLVTDKNGKHKLRGQKYTEGVVRKQAAVRILELLETLPEYREAVDYQMVDNMIILEEEPNQKNSNQKKKKVNFSELQGDLKASLTKHSKIDAVPEGKDKAFADLEAAKKAKKREIAEAERKAKAKEKGKDKKKEKSKEKTKSKEKIKEI